VRERAHFSSLRLAMAAIAGVQSLDIDKSRQQVFVIGNEAADVDSLISAYAMAQFLDSDKVQGIALAQILREEFRLRGDALALFRRAGSPLLGDGSPARLLFWDEVDWGAVHSLSSRSLVLTDHNKMTAKVAEHFEGRVERIFDHHADTGSYPDAEVIIDEALGSACTLVVEQFSAAAVPMSAEIGTLLAGVILLDTRNFNPIDAKGTPRDKDALDRLSEFIPAGRGSWYDELMAARKDVSHLSVRELLLLDLKTANTSSGRVIAFSSIFGPIRDVCEGAGGAAPFLEEAEAMAESKGYDAMVVLFSKDSQDRKAIAFVPGRKGGHGLGICEVMSEHLVRAAPGAFAGVFSENPLFASQGILEEGFGLVRRDDLQPLMAFTLRKPISRKTLLPFAMSASAL